MGFLSGIGGLLPTAYQGFKKGVDDETARQQRTADAKYQEEQRARARSMAPLEDEARVSRLRASIGQDATAGLEGEIKHALLKEQQKNLPEQLAAENIARELENATKASQAAPALFAMGGQAIATGDAVSLNRTIGHLVKSGLVQMPDGRKLEPPVSSAIVEAPKGSVDFVGQPIEGRAIQATMPDGSKQYVSTKFMDDAYKRQLKAADEAGAKVLKPGDDWRTPSGRRLAEGKEKVYPGGVVEDANGDFVRIPGVGGTGAGSRSGAGGKAPADAGKQAQDALEFLTKSEEFKTLTTSQVASAQLFTGRAAAVGVSPNEAAFIGVEVAKDPTKIKTYVDESGDVQSAYSDPNINGGRPTVLATGVSSLAEVAKTPEGLKSVTAAVTGILDGQVMDTSKAKTPEEQKAVRDQFIKAAHSPTERAALLKAIEGAGPKAVAAMDKKLDLIRAYGPKQTAEKPAAQPSAGSSRSLFGGGGMTPPEKYVPRAGVPDDIARRASQSNEEVRRRSAEREAKKAEEVEAKAEKKATAQKEIAWLTESEARVMSPSEAAGYLSKYGAVLPSNIQAALRRRQ